MSHGWNFDYRYAPDPTGPGLMIHGMRESVPRTCLECKQGFLGSRIAKRCAKCRPIALERRQARANAGAKAKRARLRALRTVALAFLLAAIPAHAQGTVMPAPPMDFPVPVPTPASAYIGGGAALNQLAKPRWTAWMGAFYPVGQDGVYLSTVADIIPVRQLDPGTGRYFYAVSGSIRQGIHKRLIGSSASRVQMFLGVDAGAGFSQGTAGAATVMISLAGSFTATTAIDLSRHFAIIIPIRALWLAQTHSWNPVPEAGVVWKP